MNDSRPEEPVDPVDLLVKYVPRHVWVTIIAVAAMVVISWLFFKPPQPTAGADAEIAAEALEGRIIDVLSEEELIVAGQAQPVQRVLVEITSGSRKGQRVEILHGEMAMLTEGARVGRGIVSFSNTRQVQTGSSFTSPISFAGLRCWAWRCCLQLRPWPWGSG